MPIFSVCFFFFTISNVGFPINGKFFRWNLQLSLEFLIKVTFIGILLASGLFFKYYLFFFSLYPNNLWHSKIQKLFVTMNDVNVLEFNCINTFSLLDYIN